MKKGDDIEMTKVSTNNSPNHHGGFGKSNSFKINGQDAVYVQHIDHDHEHSLDHEHHSLHDGDHKVYYIIDAESLKSGNATIAIKDKSATPGALGLLGFGLTTFLLNLHNAGVFPMNTMIMAMGLCYGGLAQVIVGILEF
jgi:hypothetical protein